MKNVVTAGFLALSFLISSCATMLKGTTDQVTVISDPPGAQVTSNDSPVGVTPVSFTVPSKKDLNIEVSKVGYQPQTMQNEANFRWGYEIWAFLVYIIPGVVDCADGAAWGHDDLVMTTHLEPIAQPSPVAPTAATPPAVAPVATAVAIVPATVKP
jgi:PEGA domain